MSEKEPRRRGSKSLDPSIIERSLSLLEQWEIDPDDLEIQKRIGSGGFAEVFLGYRKSDGTVVAIKKLHKQQFDSTMLDMFRREIVILTKLSHFAILPFVGACTKPPYCIVTQFMSGGSLFARLHSKDASSQLSATQLTIIALGIAYGMSFLHEKQMIHRDLKSLNILLDEDDFPKICDFGMARTKNTGSEPMTGEIGTSQWMAPEVLASQNYDEKADVYSYGIIIWEMLTGDIPYRGLRDIQVAMTVVNQNNRPKIPKNCPQNLSKFIKVCWSNDPKQRPDFNSIVRALESGAISFPGSDISKLKAYVSQFNSPSHLIPFSVSIPQKNFDSSMVTSEYLSGLISQFKFDPNSVITLVQISYKKEFISQLVQYGIIEVIIYWLIECNDATTIVYILSLLYEILMEKSFISAFIKEGGKDPLLALLLKFYTSMIPKLIDCLMIVVKNDHILFQASHMTRLSPFLLCSDLVIRQTAVRLINNIIDRKCYQDPYVFLPLLENIYKNLIVEALYELLVGLLSLLLKLMGFEQILVKIKSTDGLDRVLTLLRHDSPSVLTLSLRIIRYLSEGQSSKSSIISTVIIAFPSIIQKSDTNGQTELIKLILLMMNSTTFYSEISNCSAFASGIQVLLMSKDPFIQINTLKICYSLCSNAQTANALYCIMPNLLTLLSSNSAISNLSSCCIVALHAFTENASFLENEMLISFLKHSLSQTSMLCQSAIRIAGVMCATIEGFSILEKNHILEMIPNLITCPNQEIAILSMMALTTISAISPDSQVFKLVLPLFSSVLKDRSYGKYPYICLSNVTVIPDNACLVVDLIPYIAQNFDTFDSIIKQQILVLLYRIATTPESSSHLNSEHFISIYVSIISRDWDNVDSSIIADIIDSLSSQKDSISYLLNLGILEIVDNKLKRLTRNDPSRLKYFRVFSRLNS